MKVTILCEGRINKGPEKELCTLYQQRINSIKQSGFSNFSIKQSTSKEIIKIINNKNSNTKILVLSEIGKIYSSIEFSKYIQKTKQISNPDCTNSGPQNTEKTMVNQTKTLEPRLHKLQAVKY